jgi:hypothetical protein
MEKHRFMDMVLQNIHKVNLTSIDPEQVQWTEDSIEWLIMKDKNKVASVCCRRFGKFKKDDICWATWITLKDNTRSTQTDRGAELCRKREHNHSGFVMYYPRKNVWINGF